VADKGDISIPIWEGLSSLVDKSLVRLNDSDQDRFSMLETIRGFALERLEHSGEAEEIQRAHAQFFLEFAEEAEPHLVMREQSEWFDRLEMELPSVRAALRWSLTNDTHMAAEMAAATGRLWYMRGLISEGRAWLGEALEACPLDRPHARSKIAWVLAALAWVQGDLDAAKVAAQFGAATAESANDEIGAMRCVEILALCEMEEGQYDRARRHLQDNLARSSALGEQRAGAITMGNLGRLSMLEEEFEAAAKLAVDSLAVNRRLGDQEGIAASLTNVGLCAVLSGKPTEAEPYLREGIEVARDVGRRDLVATALEGYAAALASREDNERAALLLGAAQHLRRDSEAARDPIDDKLYETTRKLLIASMGESELARLVSTGATLSADEVMLHVREGRRAPETTM
jgi:tetratricopeptide (TPR) repeat protein